MRSKMLLFAYLATLVVVSITATVSRAKQKCWWVCVTVSSPLCPGKCTFLPSQVPIVRDECVHIPPNQNGAFPVDHSPLGRSGDIYQGQCVPCDAPEGATEPQFMQWVEGRFYACGILCFGCFVTTKGEGPQEPVPVPYPCLEQVEIE